MPHFQCTTCSRSSLVRSNFKFTPDKLCICVVCWKDYNVVIAGREASLTHDGDLFALDHPEIEGDRPSYSALSGRTRYRRAGERFDP